MASGPIISWEIDGETVETVSDFILAHAGEDGGRSRRGENFRWSAAW